jgi:hypothetical protein
MDKANIQFKSFPISISQLKNLSKMQREFHFLIANVNENSEIITHMEAA